VIAGSDDQLTTTIEWESFELFRNSQRGLPVLTYDELFRRMNQLIDLLEGRGPLAVPASANEPEVSSEPLIAV